MEYALAANDDTPPSWFRVCLAAEAVRRHDDERLKLAFDSAYIDAGLPNGMTLYLARNRDGSAELYLSPGSLPAAADLLQRFGASDCDRPARPILRIGGHRICLPAAQYRPGPAEATRRARCWYNVRHAPTARSGDTMQSASNAAGIPHEYALLPPHSQLPVFPIP